MFNVTSKVAIIWCENRLKLSMIKEGWLEPFVAGWEAEGDNLIDNVSVVGLSTLRARCSELLWILI